MRLIRNLVLFLVALIVLLAAGAYLLPRHVVVERTTTIAAPPEAIFPHLNSLEKTAAWSPWLARDPATKVTYDGPAEGTGSKMSWTSEELGDGTQEITASAANERVDTALDFGDMGQASAWFVLAPDVAAGSTVVTWGMDADMGNNPIGRWMGLMMDRWVGADYDAGLANLKTLVEGG
jgi:uncharacterized protein YndB with AHSA1/START domain